MENNQLTNSIQQALRDQGFYCYKSSRSQPRPNTKDRKAVRIEVSRSKANPSVNITLSGIGLMANKINWEKDIYLTFAVDRDGKQVAIWMTTEKGPGFVKMKRTPKKEKGIPVTASATVTIHNAFEFVETETNDVQIMELGDRFPGIGFIVNVSFWKQLQVTEHLLEFDQWKTKIVANYDHLKG